MYQNVKRTCRAIVFAHYRPRFLNSLIVDKTLRLDGELSYKRDGYKRHPL